MTWFKKTPTKGMQKVKLEHITFYTKEQATKFQKELNKRGIGNIMETKPNLGYEIRYGVIKRK